MNEEFSQPIDPGLASCAQQQQVSGKLFPHAPENIAHDHSYEDFKASQALEGLPKGEMADKMELYERQYSQWFSEGAVDIPNPSRLTRWLIPRLKLTRDQIVELAASPLRIFRQEIKELALALAKELNDKKALRSMADIGQAHIQSQKRDDELRRFMFENFEDDLQIGTARNMPLHQIAMGIMIRSKSK